MGRETVLVADDDRTIRRRSLTQALTRAGCIRCMPPQALLTLKCVGVEEGKKAIS